MALEELTAAVASYTFGPAHEIAWNRSFQLGAMTSVPFTPRLGAAR